MDEYTALTTWWRGLSSDDSFLAVAPPTGDHETPDEAAAAELQHLGLPPETPWAGWGPDAERSAFRDRKLVFPLTIAYSGPRDVVRAALGEPPAGFALHGGERDGAPFIIARNWVS